MDDIDRKILHLLQHNCRFSVAEIGEKVGLSASACHRRIGLLEKDGVIESYAARLNGEKLGYNMMFYVEVSLESQNDAVLNTFEKAALARPEERQTRSEGINIHACSHACSDIFKTVGEGITKFNIS